MQIIKDKLPWSDLCPMAEKFGNMVKGVVDVEKELLALDAELHSDLEALLLEAGSKQKDLWGVNIYPDLRGDDRIEFDSMINIRPSQGNSTRGVENADLREKIAEIITKKLR